MVNWFLYLSCQFHACAPEDLKIIQKSLSGITFLRSLYIMLLLLHNNNNVLAPAASYFTTHYIANEHEVNVQLANRALKK